MSYKRIVAVEDGEPRVVTLLYLVVGAFEMPLTALILVAMVENHIMGSDPGSLLEDGSRPLMELLGHDPEAVFVPVDASQKGCAPRLSHGRKARVATSPYNLLRIGQPNLDHSPLAPPG